MKIGITGAHGFVGSHLVDALMSLPDVEVEAFDRKNHDLMHAESLKPFVEDKELIFHLASVNRDTGENLIRVNTLGTFHLMEALSRHARPGVRLIYLSTFQVYQTPKKLESIEESHPPHPTTVYGVSKKAAEDIVACYPCRAMVLRGSNFFGPRCKPYYNSVISTFCDLLSKDKPLVVNGSGEQGRDFLYISDAVEVLVKALHCEPEGMEITNLSSGTPVTINQIIKLLGDVSGKTVNVEYRQNTEEEIVWWGDNTRCRQKFNWAPRVDIEKGLQLTYESFERRGK